MLRSSLPPPLINQEIFKFPSTFDCINKPPWLCPTACPSLTRTAPIFRWDFPALQCASAASSSPCAANSLQLFFKFGPTLVQRFINPLSQVHERFNCHS